MDIAAAEEEIARWKAAAEQEAAAGTGVEQEFVAQVILQVWHDIIFFAWLPSCLHSNDIYLSGRNKYLGPELI